MAMRGKRFFVQLGSAFLALVLLCAFAVSAAAAETEEIAACFEHGDVNMDGRVNSRDAIYTLYHSIFTDSPEYAVEQDCDFTGDGLVDRQDAIYVLYSTFGIFEDYAMEGTVHSYYEPLWIWSDEGDAQAVFNCSCGQSVTLTSEDAVAVEKRSEIELNCTGNGVVEYAASVSFGEQEYTSVHTVLTPAPGHTMVGERSCSENSYCEACGFTLVAPGHAWVLDEENSTEATCLQQAIRIYVCETCGETSTEVLDGFADHSFVYLEDRVSAVGSSCVRQPVYACDCGAEELGEPYAQHVYTMTLTREATCSVQGIMTETCELCGDTDEVLLKTVADAHTWAVEGADESYTYYRCEGCGEAKKTVNAENGWNVSTELLSGSELQVEDVTLALDEDTLADLGCSVAVNVTEADVSGILDREALDQIGDNTVYDFSMVTHYDDGRNPEEVSSFGGGITISLPYTLQTEDDPECIDVWFISDDGVVECVQGTYANGYVTFTTDHFSYYTVTRLTPAQRCEQYGHNMVHHYREATCGNDGYRKDFCLRCGFVEADNVLPRLEHAYEDLSTPATCTKDGRLKQKCSGCGHEITGTIPALGHSWVLDEEASQDADCRQNGDHVYVCTNAGCRESYTETLPQLEHKMELVEEKKNGCSNSGWNLYRCAYCGYEVKEKETSPHGHYYDPADAIVEWSEDYSSATVTLICSHDKSTVSAHTRVLKAAVSHKTQAATCQNSGKIVHTAEVSYNKQDFSFTVEENVPATDHRTGNWEWDANEHYKRCEDCGAAVYQADHSWSGEVVTRKPTCKEAGSATVRCGICDYEKQRILPATGKHTFVNGKCSGCGYVEGSCDHVARHEVPVDLSGYDICKGANIVWVQCDCGQERELAVKGLACWMNTENVDRTTPEGADYPMEINTCNQCGLVFEYCSEYPVLDTEKCEVTYYWNHRLILDGEVILECFEPHAELYGEHGIVRYGEKTDLGALGFCGGYVQKGSCYCGANEILFVRADCRWDDYYNASCPDCGSSRSVTETDITPVGNCVGTWQSVCSYAINGNEVYRAELNHVTQLHDYQPVNHVMAGNSCPDGVRVDFVCSGCGKERTEYYGYHSLVYREEIPLGWGFCIDRVTLVKCPCGESQDYYPPEGCNVEYIVEDDWNFTTVCQDCGMTIVHETVWSGKDAQCVNRADQTVTFKDRSGNVFKTLHAYWSMEQHNNNQKFELLGEKCTDGVDIVISCSDCGTEFNRFTNYQHVRTREAVGLGEYGICGGDLYIYRCPCGEYTSHSYEGTPQGGCQWVTENVKGNEIRTCHNCGITIITERSAPETIPGEVCRARHDTRVTVFRGDELVKTFEYSTKAEHHVSVICEMELLPGATSCEGGYKIWRSCADCGMKFNNGNAETLYGHKDWCVKLEDTGAEGLCGRLRIGTYRCACGQETWTHENWSGGECDFDYNEEYYIEAENAWASDCTKCGATRVRTWESVEDDDPCYETNIQTFSYRKDGKELCFYERTNRNESHENCVWSFNMQGSTCEDGYYVTGFCHTCGRVVVAEKLHTDCRAWLTKYEVLISQEDGICSDLILKEYTSPCGKYVDTYLESEVNCSWAYWGEDEQGNNINYCTDCGLKRTYIGMGEEQTGCVTYERWRYVYDLNGTVAADVLCTSSWENHSYLFTFDMQGDTCQDGYWAIGTCERCGKTMQEGMYNFCSTFPVRREVKLSGGDICGDIIEEISECPCGQEIHRWVDDNRCRWNYLGVDKTTGASNYQCVVCGLEKASRSTSETDPENCQVIYNHYYTYSMDGTVLADFVSSYANASHTTVYEFDLYGTSCGDGWKVIRKCKYCDFRYEDNAVYTNHAWYTMESLSLQEFGLCSGRLQHQACPCGKMSGYRHDDSYCSWSYTGNTDSETGLEEAYCSKCNTYRYMRKNIDFDPERCSDVGTFYIKYVRKGETVLERTYPISQENHLMRQDSYTYYNEEKGCAGGGTYMLKCKYCDYAVEGSWAGTSTHMTILDTFDMKEVSGDTCGGRVEIYGCPCGESGNVRWDLDCDYTFNSWYETGVDGLDREFIECSCDDCGIVLLRELYYVDDLENCQRTSYCEFTVLYHGEKVESWELTDSFDEHEYGIVSVRLEKGAETCDDGVVINYRCKRCESGYQSYSSGHVTMVTDSIDLAQYGAVCGSTLDLFECACGYIHRYDISDECCDIDRIYTENFVEGDINAAQWSTEGYRWFSTDSYILTCAVTDPVPCGLKIRMSEYWRPEDGCMAAEYQTWQLGYDDQTGDFQYDFTVATGERRAYHNVEVEHINELRDGEYVYGSRYNCPDCGSSAYDLNFRRDGENDCYLYERYAVNTLDNGEKKEWREVYEWSPVHENIWLNTMYRSEYTNADGSEYWYQHEYAFSYPDGCSYVQTNTNSDGGYSVYNGEHCNSNYGRCQVILDPTCSQFGVEQYQNYCPLCGEVTYEGTSYSIEPTCHDWYWDYDREIYYCHDCGLENTNGASGQIVMEDMTDAYGNGESYVVGYWNRDSVAVEAHVSVILDEVEGDNEYVLSGIGFTVMDAETDGITAYAFSQADALAIARETMNALGYDGAYAIRFSFVPLTGETNLDYAITFDSLAA